LSAGKSNLSIPTFNGLTACSTTDPDSDATS